MIDWLQSVFAAQAMSPWEAVAVIFAIAYLLLAVRENVLCWLFALMSTAIFTILFWDVSLLMESALQVYYLGMAVYGWWQWQHGTGPDNELLISRWNLRQHLLAVGAVLLASLLSGSLLQLYSEAALPFLDSFTTWASV